MPTGHSVLTWKYEDGDDEDDADVGPAWVTDADGGSEKVDGGKWLTRAEARVLAARHGYDFAEDDGREDPDDAQPHAETVKAINRKLRRFGVSRDELQLSPSGRDVFLMGSSYWKLEDDPPIRLDNPFGFRTGGASMTLDEALAKIRRLVPDWDTAP